MAFRSVTCTLSVSSWHTVTFDEDAGRHVRLSENIFSESFFLNDTAPDIKTYRARACPCVWDANLPTFYCVEGTGDLCRVKRGARERYFRGENPVVCVKSAPTQDFIRSVWPVIPLSFGALILSLLVTRPGRNALKFLFSICFRRLNDRLVTRIYRREMMWLERARAAVQRDVNGTENGEERRPPSSYLLKTETYDTNKMLERRIQKREQKKGEGTGVNDGEVMYASNSESGFDKDSEVADTSASDAVDDTFMPHEIEKEKNQEEFNQQESNMSCEDEEFLEEGVTCTICILEVEDGDRIGVLPCDHYFHVDCLKPWILKKNCCPLCQERNIAEPRYDNNNDDDENENATQEDSDRNEANQSEDGGNNGDVVLGQWYEGRPSRFRTMTARIRSTRNSVRERFHRYNNNNTVRISNGNNILHIDSITTEEAIIHRRLRSSRRYAETNRFLVWLGLD